MKLNYFKFQDGKVFWLPEYPEKPKDYRNSPEEEIPWQDIEDYDKAIAQSLASAIEVAPEDVNDFKLLWERTYRGVPMSGKVYSVECEMEIGQKCQHKGIHNSTCIYRQVARLKPKDEIPAANSHDMKDDDL